MKIIANFRPASAKNLTSDMLSDLYEAVSYTNNHLMNKHKLMYTTITPYYKCDTSHIIEFSIDIIPLSDWDGCIPETVNLSQIARYLLSRYPDKYRPLVGKGCGNRLFNINVEVIK